VLVEVKVPPLAESIADATVMEWRKQPGEAVKRGENLVDLETDKVTLEVTAPQDGVVQSLKKQNGDTVLSDELLAVIDTEAEATVAASPATETAAQVSSAAATGSASVAEPVKLSPAARKLASDKAIDTAAIPASGKDGRVTKSDVVAYLSQQPDTQATAQPEAATAPVAPPSPLPAGDRPEQRVPMTRLRKRAAERLLSAQHEHAILTTFNDVNMQPLMDLRARYRDSFEKAHGIKLGFMSLFAKATVEALKRFPVVNASVDGDDIVYHGYYDLGIAVSSPRGLVVPVIRDCDALSCAEIETQLKALSDKARNSTLAIEDLTGGTFTLTNGGVFGSLLSTPILNPPQSAILGMHSVQDRPVAENGQVVIRPMMYVALSYDHRIIDGRDAVQFLVAIKANLEDPARMLLGL
jgi:2-oxoglutarate dehydrogenase E2 component (dihydrolipoamide succinyltransferase)